MLILGGIVDRCENLIHRNSRRYLSIRGADRRGRVVSRVTMPMSELKVVNTDCPAAITRSWLHFRSVSALNALAVNHASVSRIIRRRSAARTLGVGLGADIGPRSDPASFGLIVLSTGSLDNSSFSSLK